MHTTWLVSLYASTDFSWINTTISYGTVRAIGTNSNLVLLVAGAALGDLSIKGGPPWSSLLLFRLGFYLLALGVSRRP